MLNANLNEFFFPVLPYYAFFCWDFFFPSIDRAAAAKLQFARLVMSYPTIESLK